MIKDLSLGPAEFNAMVVSAEIRQTKAGENFGVFEVRDKSTSIKLMVFQWDSRDRAMPKPGNIMSVEGVIEEYKGSRQCKCTDFGYLAPSQVDMSSFMPTSARPAEEMHSELVEKVTKRIKSDPLRAMLLDMIQDEKIKAALLVSPASKYFHDAERGGLLSHVLDLWGLAEGVIAYYGDLLNSDLLLAYCPLHDLLKIRELSSDAGFEYTKVGNLIGHVVLGAHYALGYTRKHKVPEDLAVKLVHGIVSHHGPHSELQPRTIEAVVFHELDMIASRVSAIKQAFAEEGTGAERVMVPILKEHLYR